ncbi:MAG: hypothetical protein J7K72_02405, partial [Candidatus Aenigmarchaeota archaeon]|nr:hypothetical protein [Candidatus Aenigmarchaeota archaeon]
MFSKGVVFVIWILFFIIITANTVSAELNVSLTNPPNHFIFNSTNNITFNCSVSGSNYLKNVSLYHNIDGNFILNQTIYIGEYGVDTHTEFLCHFNGELECYGGNISDLVEPNTLSYEPAKFYEGVLVNDSDQLAYDFDTTFDREQGTIEVWIKKTSDLDVNSGTYYILEVGKPVAEENNEFQMYISYGYLYFTVFDSDATKHYVRKNISFFQDGNLYHIVGIWDLDSNVSGNHRIELYINSSNASNEYSGTDVNITMDGTPDSVSVGVWKGKYGYRFNSIIDELRILDYVLSPSEINESYHRVLMNATNVSFVLNNIPDGTYVWNCLAYDNESQSNWSSSNYTFSVDLHTPPSINLISLSPSSLDDIDPGVTINVTANVTDVSNVSFAILQYKECSECAWVNETMNKMNEDEWNASFTTVSNERIYYYRVCSNDTLGHWGCSDTQNVSVTWDYTWVMNDSDLKGIKRGFVDKKGEIGILVINNTGDDTLKFTITDNWYREVYYNGSTECQFSLPNKSVEYVNITALFEDHPSETNFTINITAIPYNELKTATPQYRTIEITVNSYTGGPYFNVYILSPPTTVYQSETFNLTAKVKNIGNESSTNTWLNWSLPTGWDVVSGNLSNNISTLKSGDTYVSNITVHIDPNRGNAGVHEIYVNVTCNENTNGSASAVIGVECNDNDGICGAGCSYVTDDDCSAPSGAGKAIAYYPVVPKQYVITVSAPQRIDINRGETKTFIIEIGNNISDTELNNVHISISGYPLTFIEITPEYIDKIKYRDIGYFNITVKAPIYAKYKEYYLNITIQGEFNEKGKTVRSEKSVEMLLVTHKFIENQTLGYFESAREAVKEMNESGFETKQVINILDEVEKALDEGDYDKVRKLSDKIVDIKNLAFRLNEQMHEIEKNVEYVKKYNVVLPETEKMLFLVKSAFQRGDYDRADKRMSSALLAYTVEMRNANLWIFVYNYWWVISGIFIVSITGISMLRKRLIIKTLERGLNSLIHEERTIRDFMVNLQKEHFIEKKIGTTEYMHMMENYERHIRDISERRIEILSRLVKMLKVSNALKKLRQEESKVKKMIQDLQIDYFKLGKMGRRYYET